MYTLCVTVYATADGTATLEMTRTSLRAVGAQAVRAGKTATRISSGKPKGTRKATVCPTFADGGQVYVGNIDISKASKPQSVAGTAGERAYLPLVG